MFSNTGNAGVAEENNPKDTSGRLVLQPIDPLTVVLTGRYGARGEENTGALSAGTAAVRLDVGSLDVMVEGLTGTDDEDVLDDDRTPFVGGNAAAGLFQGVLIAATVSIIMLGWRLQQLYVRDTRAPS